MKPSKGNFQFVMTRFLVGSLPPFIAPRLRSYLYNFKKAKVDDLSFVTKSKTGSLFAGRTSEFHSYPFSIQGYYEWRNIAIAKAVSKPGDDIIEVGANVGTETIGLADTVTKSGKVHAFEPIDANIDTLKELINLNHYQHVILYPYAAGNVRETIKFVRPPAEMSGMGHVLGSNEIPKNEVLDIECYPLDAFASRITHLSSIFIDAEGADLLIIKGARQLIRSFRPVIVFEISKRANAYNLTKKDFTTELNEMDYGYFRIGRFRLEPVDLLSTHSENWVGIPGEKKEMVKRINKSLFFTGIMPFLGRLNPLSS